MSGAPELVAMGEPMLEFNQMTPADGPPYYVPGFGGDTSNCAIAAARQGAKAGYFTALGEDMFGDEFMALWRAEGVDCSTVLRSPDAQTGIYFISHGAEGHRFTYYRAGSAASRITADDVPRDYIAGARILHVSAISQAISDSACEAVFTAMKIAKANGVTVAYDTNLRLQLWSLDRARAVIHATVALADIALPNLEESRQLSGLHDPAEIVAFYRAMGPAVVALKCGPEGAHLGTAAGIAAIPGRAVDQVDASGAGDTFDGAFLAETLRGVDPLAAARYANAAAALAVTGYGAVTPIPRRADVEAFLQQA